MTLIIINVPQCFLVEACALGRVNNWYFFKLDTLQRMTLGQNPSTEGIDAQKGKGSAEGIVSTELSWPRKFCRPRELFRLRKLCRPRELSRPRELFRLRELSWRRKLCRPRELF